MILKHILYLKSKTNLINSIFRIPLFNSRIDFIDRVYLRQNND